MQTIYDRLRVAWDAGVPLALDRVAEQLAHEGVAESAILDELMRLLLEVRAAGADEETEERIHGVMDRLTGWCHESNHIKTKRLETPEPTNGATQQGESLRGDEIDLTTEQEAIGEEVWAEIQKNGFPPPPSQSHSAD